MIVNGCGLKLSALTGLEVFDSEALRSLDHPAWHSWTT
jgi:hypothetical protein